MDSENKSFHVKLTILGLCAFIWFLAFKPSEPYLSQFLICNATTQLQYCQGFSSQSNCDESPPCIWDSHSCITINCSNVSIASCGNDDFNYCFADNSMCQSSRCYQRFSADEVNNEIYPWSTYAYLPFLLLLGPFAELFSYRIAILFGIFGRVVTRFLLIFGNTLVQMQVMQVAYSMGTAAEDIFSAYIYYVVPPQMYTHVTSYVKSSAFIASVLSGILGDILVTQFNTSLDTLNIISACSVCLGAMLGACVIRSTHSINLSSSTDNIVGKLNVFSKQINELIRVLKKSTLLALVCYWIVGNAIFMTVYNYEVSIFDELNGSNSWNGSVLSIMLFGGSVGALIPTYIKTGEMSQRKLGAILAVAEVIAFVTLLFAIYTWDIVPTISLLTLFFTSWQFINVVTYSQIALHLKESSSSKLLESKTNENFEQQPPFSIAIVLLVASNVVIQIVLTAVLFTGLELALYESMLLLAILFGAVSGLHCIWLIFFIKD